MPPISSHPNILATSLFLYPGIYIFIAEKKVFARSKESAVDFPSLDFERFFYSLYRNYIYTRYIVRLHNNLYRLTYLFTRLHENPVSWAYLGYNHRYTQAFFLEASHRRSLSQNENLKMSKLKKGEPFPVLTTRVNHKSHRIKLNRV